MPTHSYGVQSGLTQLYGLYTEDAVASVTSVEFSPNGEWILSADADLNVKLWGKLTFSVF